LSDDPEQSSKYHSLIVDVSSRGLRAQGPQRRRPLQEDFNDPCKGEERMRQLAFRLWNFLKNEEGPTAVEYAVMLALIIVVCIVSVIALGTNSNTTFSYVASRLGKTGS
jgi:pilus assembly protein Flp/PilA